MLNDTFTVRTEHIFGVLYSAGIKQHFMVELQGISKKRLYIQANAQLNRPSRGEAWRCARTLIEVYGCPHSDVKYVIDTMKLVSTHRDLVCEASF